MWISQGMFEELLKARAKAEGEAHGLAQNNRALEVTMDWLRVRVTQLEHERAILISNYMGINVPTPTIAKVPNPGQLRDNYHAVPHFNDIGDDEASRLGVSWNEDGTVKYSETR